MVKQIKSKKEKREGRLAKMRTINVKTKHVGLFAMVGCLVFYGLYRCFCLVMSSHLIANNTEFSKTPYDDDDKDMDMVMDEAKYYEKSRRRVIETECDYGARGPRILCAVFTHRLVHKTTLLPVHNTWAKR